jgi:uncharacterized cupredoxin-like copper-binding protein
VRNVRTILLAAAALAVAVLVAACGEDRNSDTGGGGGTGQTGGETGASTATGSPVATVQVGETEYKLNPSSPKIGQSGVIQFQVQNKGQVPHALEIETPGGEIRTDTIQPGKSATLKANLKPGTYEWYCPIDDHKGKGMRGTIVVGGGSAGGAGTGTSTGEDNGGGDRGKEDSQGGGSGGSDSGGGGY